MSRVSVVIDGKCEFDGELGEWVSTPPDFVKDLIKPGAKPQPHMKAIMLALTDALMLQQTVSIEAKTWIDGWSITVESGKQ